MAVCKLLTNARVVTMADGHYSPIENGAIAIKDGHILWVGNMGAIPDLYEKYEPCDLGGSLVTPGLVDCHSHLVFGGDRAREFEMRLKGASYEEIARAGGGIVSTVTATRNASLAELIDQALPRLDALLAEGICTLEVKSGYGLDRETEMTMLRAARNLSDLRPVRIKTTFLGAHALPADYQGRADRYIDEICIPTLKAAAKEGLVDAVDGFCEGIAFNTDQISRVFDVAKSLGLPVKLHAEQLSNIGGTRLAAQYGALSVDHVEYANEEDVMALARSGTVAVLLPGAFYTLRETQMPPVSHFRNHQVPMALATDCNPGTSPLSSLLLTMNMACTLFRMTPEEALAGVTIFAAKALGLTDAGVIKPGYRADLAIWNVRHPAELAYRIGFNPLKQRLFAGK